MTDSVDTTDALRVLADNINVAPAIWGHDAVWPLRAAADEIDALRARCMEHVHASLYDSMRDGLRDELAEARAHAERAEAAIADLRGLSSQYDDDTQEYWVPVNDIEMILSRASQPASDPRETEHIECDCVPHLGPTHCHLCSTRTGREMPWSEAHPQPAPEVEQ